MSHVDLNRRPVLADHVRLKTDPVSGDPVLLFPEGVLILNSTAHDIVLLCDGEVTGREILTALSADYEVEEAVLRADLVDCLADLLHRNLILLKP
jgi:pyrroloquinoline quinone biosynthesis protein D